MTAINVIREALMGTPCYTCSKWTYWDYHVCKHYGIITKEIQINCSRK
jgi:hypothetical protein